MQENPDCCYANHCGSENKIPFSGTFYGRGFVPRTGHDQGTLFFGECGGQDSPPRRILLIIRLVCTGSLTATNKKGPQNETLGAENKRILQGEARKCKLFDISEICIGLPSRFRQ